MRIPVFVSCPTHLNKAQASSRSMILRELSRQALEPRALGRSDYPTELPLREVYVIAKHCSGGVILGFSQFESTAGLWKRGTKEQRRTRSGVQFPSSWNHLEAGILFGMGIPLLVFCEPGISGGVFDSGVTDAFIHRMPEPKMNRESRAALIEVFRKWQGKVRDHYYASPLLPHR